MLIVILLLISTLMLIIYIYIYINIIYFPPEAELGGWDPAQGRQRA